MTQKELGKAVGLLDVAISKYESRGSDPIPHITRAIADYFGVRYDWLAYGEGTRMPVKRGGPRPSGVRSNSEIASTVRRRSVSIDKVVDGLAVKVAKHEMMTYSKLVEHAVRFWLAAYYAED
jgi:transcriptional regulator with XRE-family HTH domain